MNPFCVNPFSSPPKPYVSPYRPAAPENLATTLPPSPSPAGLDSPTGLDSSTSDHNSLTLGEYSGEEDGYFSDENDYEDINPIKHEVYSGPPLRPGSPLGFQHTRSARSPEASPFTRLMIILLNHLRMPLLTKAQEPIFSVFHRHREVYRISLPYSRACALNFVTPFENQITLVGFSRPPNLRHIEIKIHSSKTPVKNVEYGHITHVKYRLEASAKAVDADGSPLVLGPGEGVDGVGQIFSMVDGKQEVVGATLVTEVKIPISSLPANFLLHNLYINGLAPIIKVEGNIKTERKIKSEFGVLRKRFGGRQPRIKVEDLEPAKTWEELQWHSVLKWLKMAAKKAYNSYGEARDENDIKEWVERSDKLGLVGVEGKEWELFELLTRVELGEC